MWMIIKDHLGNKRYINVNYISDFYFNGTHTIINIGSDHPINMLGDFTKNLIEEIRLATKAKVTQIGE